MPIKPTFNPSLPSSLPEQDASPLSDPVVLHVKSAGLYAALMSIINRKRNETAAP
jgi:hypothetical protein